MKSISIRVEPLTIPFKISFSHAAKSRHKTAAVLVEASRDGICGIGEGCPRSYVTGETMASTLDWILGIRSRLSRECRTLVNLRHFVAENKKAIDEHPAAWCAIETAILDLLGKEAGQSVEALVGAAPFKGSYTYSAVVGNGKQEVLNQYFQVYAGFRFWDYKIKVGGNLEQDQKKMALFREKVKPMFPGTARLRVDANNFWGNDSAACRSYIEALGEDIMAVEEPLTPRAWEDLSRLSQDLNLPVILDESLCTEEDLALFAGLPGKFIANIRVSKAGGLLRGLSMVEAACKEKWPVIIGAQVGETSILTRLGLTLATAAKECLFSQEGAFGTLLLAHDIVTPVLMFGKGGVLEIGDDQARRPGLGFARE